MRPADDGPFDKLFDEIRRLPADVVSAQAKIVYSFMAALLRKGRPVPGQRLTAYECGCSKSTVVKCQRELVEAQLLVIVDEANGRRRRFALPESGHPSDRSPLRPVTPPTGSGRAPDRSPVTRPTATGHTSDHNQTPDQNQTLPEPRAGDSRSVEEEIRRRFDRVREVFVDAFGGTGIGRLTKKRREALADTLDVDADGFELELRCYVACIGAEPDLMPRSVVAHFAADFGQWARRRGKGAAPKRRRAPLARAVESEALAPQTDQGRRVAEAIEAMGSKG